MTKPAPDHPWRSRYLVMVELEAEREPDDEERIGQRGRTANISVGLPQPMTRPSPNGHVPYQGATR